jgi:L-ascorbate metabolism protein UlaG (beta-lactamase superfamily)
MAEVPSSTRAGRIGVAAVPVWGWGPRLGPGHLDPVQAAEAVVRARAVRAVPVHWGTLHPVGLRQAMRGQLRTPGVEFASALEVVAAARGLPARAHVLRVGDSLTEDPGLPAVGDAAPPSQA